MSTDEHLWDLLYPELMRLSLEPWGERIAVGNRQQHLATLFAMRAFRRLRAVDGMFTAGLYPESHALVRVSYEDWLQVSYVLRLPGEDRCKDFSAGIYKHDARVYDAFKAFCGSEAAQRYFGDVPLGVADFVGRPRSETGSMPFAFMADDISLRPLYDFVYVYLSGRSHPDARMNDLFDSSESASVARIPTRDPEEEARLAIWFGWFTTRVFVRAASEFGVDHEPWCDEFLVPIAESGPNLESCVLMKEYG